MIRRLDRKPFFLFGVLEVIRRQAKMTMQVVQICLIFFAAVVAAQDALTTEQLKPLTSFRQQHRRTVRHRLFLLQLNEDSQWHSSGGGWVQSISCACKTMHEVLCTCCALQFCAQLCPSAEHEYHKCVPVCPWAPRRLCAAAFVQDKHVYTGCTDV